MHIITIDAENSDVLSQAAAEVNLPLTPDVIDEIKTMREFYIHSPKKSGFAAPQVGILKKIILIEEHLFGGDESIEPVILINPEWQPINDEKALDFEGCLSVPGKMGFVERYTHVRLTAWRYFVETNALIKIEREYHREFASALWQHEGDHLNGVVYIDKAKLVITDEEFALLQYQLIQTGQWQQGMTFFDVAPVMYQLALEKI